jgi:uncharacterized alkaline shock family protein YloU
MQTWPNGTAGLTGAPHRASIASAASAASLDDDTRLPEQLGAVRIAPRVLRTVVAQAALGVRGVARMAEVQAVWPRALGRPLPRHGVGLAVHHNAVTVDLYLIVDPGVSMVDVGTVVQEAVGAAVEHILGMDVAELNVYIQDVA